MPKTDSQKAYHKAWRTSNRDKLKKYRKNADLKKDYGISLDTYNAMLLEQAGLCAICNEPETQECYRTGVTYNLAVDHCHASGNVRQLLCSRCNRTLGMVNDDTKLLKNMIAYLEKFV